MTADQELIRRIGQGDSAAVAELYSRYAPVVWRYVFAKMRRDVHAGQDVLSETFLAAIRSLKNGTTTANVSAWLFGIARHKIADWCRHRAASQPTDRARTHSGEVAEREVLAGVLDALPDEERIVLEWKYLDRCSVSEIAQRMGRTEKGVEGLLYRARQAFRALYQTALE